MTEAYVDKSYVFAVARLRHEELKLFNAQIMEQLITAKTVDEAVRTLKEKGWGSGEDTGIDEILETERERLWSFVDELVPDRSVFNVFRLPDDYSNLKAAIKGSLLEDDFPGVFISESAIPYKVIRDAIKARNYQALPGDMEEPARRAHETFLRKGDGQLCDIMIDKACLDAILKAGEESGDEFIKMYAGLKAGSANIKIAVRACRTGKDREFLQMALADYKGFSNSALINAALNSEDAIAGFLGSTEFSDAVPELKKSPAAFERWCDNLVTEKTKPQLYESFGLGPIAAYILARENEIKSVRIILSAKQNGFPDEMIRERVRETYV